MVYKKSFEKRFSKLFFIRKGDEMRTHFDLYKVLGAHIRTLNGTKGTAFAVWAPNAAKVSVAGEFNEWNPAADYMERGGDGTFQIFLPGVAEGMSYQYCIEDEKGQLYWKADPYARASMLRPQTASVVFDDSLLRWNDQKWLKRRHTWNYEKESICVYEVHIGSWKKNGEGFYNYRMFAHEVAEYVLELGYTHIELMGILEHPYDGSWGYQVTGYYAPTARYGDPYDFAYMIDYLHQKNIGIILDWVPAHFAIDDHGLSCFDGTALFELAEENCTEWGTKVFDYGKEYVRQFLIGNALFWAEQYHIDGIRVDAVASMLYLNSENMYEFRGHDDTKRSYNFDAIEMLKYLNAAMREQNPDVLMIAEESSAFPKVTGNIEQGSLGFHLKWNMGFMHDSLEYLKMNQEERRKNHHAMTFASSYMHSEKYILVISHDEVVHLKKTMLNKINGFMDEKFGDLKTFYTFMIGHPGKKLLFMGQEFAQYHEWNENEQLDWYLLEDRRHKGVQVYWKALLAMYSEHPALYQNDYEEDGFRWINADDSEKSVYSFMRFSERHEKGLLFVCNFSAETWENYEIKVPVQGEYRVLLNSDDAKYGGNGLLKETCFKTKETSLVFHIATHSALIFTF